MRCKICGAQLKKDGDICKNCYEEYCKEEELEKDVNEVFRLTRKYSPKYQLTRYGDGYILAIIIILALIAQEYYLFAVLALVVALIVLGVALYYAKRRAINTTCTFYDKKIVFKYKKKEKVIPYSNLKDVTCYQNFFQKIFKYADFQFHPKSGTYIINGFEIKDIPDYEENLLKIKEIVDARRED